MRITVIKREIYGKSVYYPDDTIADKVCHKLLKQKTFTRQNLDDLYDCGFTVLVRHID